jgi:malate dehydrogenase
MLRGRIRNGGYPWPCGVYFRDGEFARVMMAADVRFGSDGISAIPPQGNPEDMGTLRDSYAHLCKLRDEIVGAGLLPPLDQWKTVNPNL